MRSKSNLDELKIISERRRWNNSISAAYCIKTLRHKFNDLGEAKGHLKSVIEYFPIAAVTNIEVYFRCAVGEIIDYGPPYAERAELIAKNVKFDLETIRALEGRQITLGEVIAHGISFQSLESINWVMTSLIDKDFLTQLRDVRDRWEVDYAKTTTGSIISDLDELCRNLSALFRARHVVVHELPSTLPFEIGDVDCFLKSAETFLDASRWFLMDILQPNAPLTQLEMNIAAAERAQKASARVDELLAQASEFVEGERLALLQEAQSKWKSYSDTEAEFVSSQFVGGSIRPAVHGLELAELARQRSVELERILKILQQPR